MRNRKNILMDVDEVICFPGFLSGINEFMNTNYVIDDFKDYYIDKVAIPEYLFDEFNVFINKKNLYSNAQLLPNAKEVIEKLNNYYNIYICSSCINPFDLDGSGRLFKDKYEFLRKELPFINPKNFIFTDSKNIINADIQIDDRISNLKNSIKIKILFPSYHNKEINDKILEKNNIIRAGYDWKKGWNEVEKILF